MSLLPYLHTVASGQSLTSDEAHAAMGVLLEGQATDALMAGFLVALRMKGETATELAGFARAMRERAVRVDAGPDLIDTCGTGGEGASTFNVSTVVALVLAGAGAKIAKHGNRSMSSRSGSADVLEALGVRIAMTPEEAARAIQEIGIGFLFAPHMHPAMKNVFHVRRELKLSTVFNLLGPLVNPAAAKYQLIGAPNPHFAQMMAEALAQLGTGHSFVVHGHARGGKGYDEVATTGSTDVYEVRGNSVQRLEWMPHTFGVESTTPDTLTGGDAQENAAIALAILNGERSPKRDIVLVNAAAGLLAAGLAHDPKDGVVRAAEAIDSGSALAVLEKLRREFPVN
jgi:anthranilate phosphoribosyltransferase